MSNMVQKLGHDLFFKTRQTILGSSDVVENVPEEPLVCQTSNMHERLSGYMLITIYYKSHAIISFIHDATLLNFTFSKIWRVLIIQVYNVANRRSQSLLFVA